MGEAGLRAELAHLREELRNAQRGELPVVGIYLDEHGDPFEFDDLGWIEFFRDQIRTIERELARNYQFARASTAVLIRRASPARRRPRPRSSRGPAPGRRRGSRRVGADSRAGPDDDGDSEPAGGRCPDELRPAGAA